MKLYRSFIAFLLPQKAIDYCIGIKETLIELGFDPKWIPHKNLHITINFMGNKSKIDILKTAEKLQKANIINNRIYFDSVKITTLGSNNSVLCLQLKDINKVATNVVNNILSNNNLESDYPTWFPHITLARIKSLKTKKLFKSYNNKNLIDNTFRFSPTSVNVYISHLTPSGAIYKKVNV